MIEHQEMPAMDRRAVRIDYLTISFRRADLSLAEAWCVRRFGQPESGPGRYFLECSKNYADGGCLLLFDSERDNMKDHAVLSLTGEACKYLGDKQLLELFHEARTQWGGHATRVDVANDLFGRGKGLIQRVGEGCMTGELVGARVHSPAVNYKGSEIAGEGWYIGKRGKAGSGRCVCVYDKGLETGQMERGEWVRWETRFYDECADKALALYAKADTPGRMLLAFDAFQFRENTGASHVDRRPMCKWWNEIRQSTDTADFIRRSRSDTTAAGFVKWVNTAVAPCLEIIRKEAGISWDDLMMGICGKVDTENARKKQHVQDVTQQLLHGFIDDDGIEHDSIFAVLWKQTVRGYDIDAV